MLTLVFSRTDQRITAYDGEEVVASYEARHAHFSGYNTEKQPYESLPVGNYTAVADEPPAEDSDEYGTFYISTGDPTGRGRDFHGGGSGLNDPKAPRQGWYPTLGCIRMQNEDGEELSRLIIAAGNEVPLEVRE
jgi:lipoprotein-anchoring transpeptidase ErfK/SrfK